MSELSRIQKSMMAFLIKKDTAIESDVVDSDAVNAKERLNIYGDGYGYRLHDALSENYPAVHTLLGDEDFFYMAYQYMNAYPSEHFSLRFLGSKLEQFFIDNYSDAPVYAEMASFEWALRKAFDAKNQETIGLEKLQEIPIESWGDLQFKFHQSVSRLDLEWNTPQLWAAIEADSDPIPPEKLEHPYAWLLWRQGLVNHYRSLDVDEAWALGSAIAGVNFEDLCQGVCEWIDTEHAPARVAGFLCHWINEGLLVDLNT